MTTTTCNPNPTQNLLTRLRALDKKFTKNLVQATFYPDWWSEEIASSPSAVQQLKVRIARQLNIELGSILDENSELRFKDTHCKFKRPINKVGSNLQVATSIAASLANIISEGATADVQQTPSPSQIREIILGQGKSWIDLESLISFCWEMGIPVLYTPDIPASKKMDGLAINVDGRPTIVLAKKYKHSAYVLFDLAHELGHIACGHVLPGSTLVDEKIGGNDSDEQESEADRFALELLNGDPDTAYHSNGNRITARNLAIAAHKKGQTAQTDPQHIIANWGKVTENWAVANAALNILDPDPNWQQLFKEAVTNGIDEDDLVDEDLDYLYMLTGIES